MNTMVFKPLLHHYSCMDLSIILLEYQARSIVLNHTILQCFYIGIGCKSTLVWDIILLHNHQLWPATKPDRTPYHLRYRSPMKGQIHKILPKALILVSKDKLNPMRGLSLDRTFIRKHPILPTHILTPQPCKSESFSGSIPGKRYSLLGFPFFYMISLKNSLDSWNWWTSRYPCSKGSPAQCRKVVGQSIDVLLAWLARLSRSSFSRPRFGCFGG